MGDTQHQVVTYRLLFLTIIGLSLVAARPASDDLQAQHPSKDIVVKDEPESPAKVPEETPKLPPTDVKQIPSVDEQALLAVLPTTLPAKNDKVAEQSPETVQIVSGPPSSADDEDVPVVIADQPLPEAMVIIPNSAPSGRFLTRMARAHFPAEARGADDSDGADTPTVLSYHEEGSLQNEPDIVVLESTKRKKLSQKPTKSPDSSPVRTPSSTLLEAPVILPGYDEEGLSTKKMRKHRVLFRTDQPTERELDMRSPDVDQTDSQARTDSRKIVEAPLNQNIQHSHTYEVTEPGRETIVLTRPNPVQSDPTDKQSKQSKPQLIRHIHHQQFVVPFINSYQRPNLAPPAESFGQTIGSPYYNNAPSSSPSTESSVRPVNTPIAPFPVTPTGGNHQPTIAIFPPVFNSPQTQSNAYSNQGSVKPNSPITGYFPFVISDPNASLYNVGLTSSITNVFEYERAPSRSESEHKQARFVRRTRALNSLPATSTPAPATTDIPDETTVLPELREIGNLAGPVVHTITQDDEEDKVQTTIVLHGGAQDEDDDDDDDDEDDDPPLSETALDENEEENEEESAPSPTSNKEEYQKKLKDKLSKIEKKIRKRIKNSQQNLQGLRKQVNRHVTEILMSSDGGMEEAGPIVSKLVVRRGGVAIAGPGGIATAGFGGTAIVGPGGTAYTSPDSLAVAGPGARVISVPSKKLQDMFDSFRKASGRNIDAFRPSWLGTIPPDGKLVATGPVVFFNPPDQLDLQEKADVHQDRIIAEAPADLSRTASEGFTPYIEPSAVGTIVDPVNPEPLGGRPVFIPVIDGSTGVMEILNGEEQRKVVTPESTSPPTPTTTPTAPSAKVREGMIAEVKEQIRAELSGVAANRPLKLIDIAAPVQTINIGLSERERAVEEALKPYQDLLSRVQESSALDLVVGDVRGGLAPTRLLLRPMAKAVAGKGGIAVAAPLSRAVVRGEQPVQVRYQPNIVAVAGPSGMAHALGELLLQYADRM